MRFSLAMIALLLFCFACGKADTKPTNLTAQPSATTYNPKDGDYTGKGKITKINNEIGSVEMDHEDIPGLMPAMRMEFYVSDKALLKGFMLDDRVDFTILYKGGTETITKIEKAK